MSKKKVIIIALLIGVVGFVTVALFQGSEDDTALNNSVFVYEFDAESAEECSSVEQFDAETSVCFFECSSDEQCEKLLTVAEEELDALLEEYEQDAANRSEDAPDDVASLEGSTVYAVATDESISVTSGEAEQNHDTVWQAISDISPDEFTASYVEAFVVYSDESDDTIAYVEDQDGDGKFDIGINLPVFQSDSKQQQSLTIVHELAHIATLNQDQAALGSCGYQTQEGCFGSDSMLARFVESFWTPEDVARAIDQEDLYSGQEDRFVTEYAATSPEEDIAESFAYYVVKSNFSGTGTSYQKQSFFEEFDYAKTLKSDMRKAVIDTIIRARVSP